MGYVPPPVNGGVDVHIHRMVGLLKKNAYNFELLGPSDCAHVSGRLRQFCFYRKLITANGSIYHVHKPDKLIRFWWLVFFLTLIGKRVIYTLHNENLADEIEQGKMNLFRRFSLKICFRAYDHVICVNQRMADILVKEGISSNKISVIPAFIPPEEIEVKNIPQTVIDFVRHRSPTLTGYMSRYYLYDGCDRYGGDMMVELAIRLKDKYPECGLIIVIPNPNEKTRQQIQKYTKIIQENNVQKNVLICTELLDLTALFQITDIHIRPSNTDGDPIAVRESLFVNTPTVASDCTYKPDGTILHKDRDHDDFAIQVIYVLEHLLEEREKLKKIKKPEFGQAVLSLYDQLLAD